MGEYAEMMLDGTCCACCGDYIGADAGFPIYCYGCAPDFKVEAFTGIPLEKPKKAKQPQPNAVPCKCGVCGKTFTSKGARKQHNRAKHSAKTPAQEASQ